MLAHARDTALDLVANEKPDQLRALTDSPSTGGTLDTSFGTGGIVITNLNGVDDEANSIAVQTDGKIVAAGFSKVSGVYDFAVARYNSDGTLDTTFNGTGKVVTAFPNANLGPYGDKTYAVGLQDDGKIVVAGYATDASYYLDIGVARYNTDGSLDATFNGTGIVTTAINSTNDIGNSLVIQSDGKIVVGGWGGGGVTSFELVRYNPDGSLDSAFNGGGAVDIDVGGGPDDLGFSVAQQGDESSFLLELVMLTSVAPVISLSARFSADGSLDTTFNGSGVVTTPTGSSYQDTANGTPLPGNNPSK